MNNNFTNNLFLKKAILRDLKVGEQFMFFPTHIDYGDCGICEIEYMLDSDIAYLNSLDGYTTDGNERQFSFYKDGIKETRYIYGVFYLEVFIKNKEDENKLLKEYYNFV